MKFVAYVINLNHRVDRLTKFYQQPNADYFQRVPAIDKNVLALLNHGQIDYCFNQHHFKQMIGRDVTLGEVACTLSHIQCWKNIAEHHDLHADEFAIVAEDDIQLQPYFYENAQRLFTEMQGQTHINILILQHLFWHHIPDLSLADCPILQFNYLKSSHASFFDFKSSALYAIRKSYAQRLMDYLSVHKPFWLADHFSCFCDVDKMCTISPLFGVVPDGIEAESDLEIERQQARKNVKYD